MQILHPIGFSKASIQDIYYVEATGHSAWLSCILISSQER